MLFTVPSTIDGLKAYLPRFFEIAQEDRWLRRANQLLSDAQSSASLSKIVTDYHWLELTLCMQWNEYIRSGQAQETAPSMPDLAALTFAAAVVEAHARFSPKAKGALAGRVLDGLKAETGFASLYQEMEVAMLLMNAGHEVEFTDMHGTANFDLRFCRGHFEGEVECKSISADAGRQIHRKDFYRFVDAAQRLSAPPLIHNELVCITLPARLAPSEAQRTALLRRLQSFLSSGRTAAEDALATFERFPLADVVGRLLTDSDPHALHGALKREFGQNVHAAGEMTAERGWLLVMRSAREDDPSAPLLDAMRKAASQLTTTRPGFIAVQEHGLEAADLASPTVRRRMVILCSALMQHYDCNHVNSVLTTAYGVSTSDTGGLCTPGFAIRNPTPKFRLSKSEDFLFLRTLPNLEFQETLGA
jgi:hypothetical protein